MKPEDPTPPVWFRLPPGFHDIGPGDRDALDCIAETLGSSDAQRDLSRLMDHLDELAAHHVVHTSVGLHPGDPAGISTSIFSLAVWRSEQLNPRVSVARTALAISRSELWKSATREFIDLPSQQPCCLVSGFMSPPGFEERLFQARIAMAHPAQGHVIVLDLTSAAIEHAAPYTSILKAIAHTISFSDPSPTRVSETSRVMDLLL
ncbi:hypothetical protein [Streptomyces goshikiensis]|uniref:hypothetical protein n=1 Tax=Streptomyces goshikiensis TaxID=1942 RepID=UPI00365323B2